MPEVEVSSPTPLAGVNGAAASIAEGHETPSPTTTSPTALAEDARRGGCREGAVENRAADRISDGPAGAHEIVGGTAPKGEGLVTLDEAVDDGTMINTAGTLIFTELEVRRLCWYV